MVKIPSYAAEVLSALEAAGFEAWCVGGCVRDSLLGRTPQDWDVTTAARPEQVLAVFGDRAVPTGLAHGTVTVKTAGGPVEVTTFRRDGAYRDHRRPQSVTFTDSLEEDLRRRDFTVNAMALDLRGNLADPLGGRNDLDAGVLRCVGEPDRRFREDALRILRGVRFAAALGFTLEPETDRSLRANRTLLAQIAPERIGAELKGLLTAPGAAEALARVQQAGGHNHIFTHRGSSTRWYLREHGLLDRFSLLVTSEDGLPRKPEPDGILRILQRSGAPREAFAMVGDREIDVLAAHNAGILACRFAPEEPDVSTEAEIVLTDLRDILKAIKEERTK